MKTNISIRCLLFIVIMSVSFINLPENQICSAEVQTIEADGYYIIGDGPDENHSVAKNRAKLEAKRSAAEKTGIFVESLTEVKNGQLTKDEINTISAQVLQIVSEKITPEIIGETVRYCCHIVAKVDSESVIEKLRQDRQKLYEAVEQNKRQQQELDAVKKELSELKARYKGADEQQQQEINKDIGKNENRIKAIELVESGHECFRSGDYKKAHDYYQKAVQINPNYDDAWSTLGSSYCKLGDYKKGKECYQKAISIKPNTGGYWLLLGASYKGLKDYQKAKESFEKAISINNNSDFSWGVLGVLYLELDNNQMAKECFLKSIRINPNYAPYWANLGLTYFKLKDYNKTKESYQKAIQIYPNYDDYWGCLGATYYFTGDYQKAKDCYEKALQINPNNDIVREWLDKVNNRIKKYKYVK